MNPVPAQCITTSRFFNHIKSSLAALGVFLLLAISFQSQAVPLPFFPDPAMQQCLDEQAVANGWLNAEDVTVFNCVDRGVRNIQGIEALINLKELDVSSNRIRDISPLNVFTGLTVLRISNNKDIDYLLQVEQIINRNPGLTRLGLAGVNYPYLYLPLYPSINTNLIELDFSNTGIFDISAIDQFQNLQILKLADNRIEDISPLSQLVMFPNPVSLRELDLSNNNISDVSTLNSFNELTTLKISGNTAIDYFQLESVIIQNMGLQRLGLAGININSPVIPLSIANLSNTLIELDMNDTGLVDVNGVAPMQTLEILKLADNQIQDISSLSQLISMSGMQNLRELDLSNNAIIDISALNGFTEFTSLQLSGNTGIDYQQLDWVLNQNIGLQRLGLAGININAPTIPLYITNLSNSLVELDMSDTGLLNIAGIEQLQKLKALVLADNQIQDIYPFFQLIMFSNQIFLQELDLSNNHILDISALNGFYELTSLNVSGNVAIDFTQLESIINQNMGLQRLGLSGININSPVVPYSITNLAYNLIELDMSDTGLADVHGLAFMNKLEILNLADNQIQDISLLSQLISTPGIQNFYELDLSNNQIIDISALNSFYELTTLKLSGNTGIDSLQLDSVLNQNLSLQRLGLAGIHINSPAIPLSITNLSNTLIELDMNDTGLVDVNGVASMQTLEILKLANNQIQDISPLSQLISMPGMQKLHELDLSNNQIIDISALNSFYELTTLKLSGNIGIDYVQLDSVLNQNIGLQRLGLAGISINSTSIPFSITNLFNTLVELDMSQAGLQNIAGIEQLQKLQILKLADNQIQDISPLSQLGMYPGTLLLRQLDLSNNNIFNVSALNNIYELTELMLSGNTGIDYLQLDLILSQNTNLQRLGIAGINVQSTSIPNGVRNLFNTLVELDMSNTGLSVLTDINIFQKLKILNLANNNITDVGSLSTLTGVNYIDLTGNNHISCDQLDQLVLSLPQASIIRPATCIIGEVPGLSISQPIDDFLILEGQGFELAGSSFDFENGDLSSQIQWSSDLEGVLGTGSLLKIQLSQPGIHQITASVTDLDNNTVSQSIQITVIENLAPTLNIFSPHNGQSIIEGTVLLGSADAFDQEDGLLGHAIHWSSDIDGHLGTGSSVQMILSVGSHLITATVTDSLGKSTSQTVPVTIIFNNPPVVTILSPASGASSIEGVSITLAASALDTEDGGLASINWQSDLQGDLGAGIDLNVNLVVGVHTITATATDSSGKTGSQSVSYEVLFNNPPVLTITSPVNGSSNIEGESATLSASAIDVEDGDISPLVSWNSDIQGSLGMAPSISVTLNAGTHVITASVSDALGKTSVQTVSYTVVFNNPPVVTITSPLANSSSIEGLTVNLIATVADTEDGDVSINTRWSSDIQGYLGMGSNLPVSLQVGVHNITATVTDSHGKTTTQTIVSTVLFNNPPVLTLAMGIDGGSSEDGLAVQLNATALDVESGDLGSIIAWSSDISGSLGVGANLSVMLPVGVHTLTVSVIDQHGKSQTVTAQYTVIEAPMLTYCDASATDTSKEWIESISLSGVTNTSGSQMGYGDFWSLGPIYLNRASNTISLTPGYSVKSRDDYWQIWIDFNRDGVFADNEVVVADSGIGTLIRNFAVPVDAVTGNTRMRIVLKHKKPSYACGSYKHGEVEDYRVIIQP